MAKNDGKLLEKKLDAALKRWQEQRPSFYHRFADTRAASQYLPVQPGDYLWLLPGLPAILLEAKSTESGAPLASLLSPGQTGKHRLWLRAKHHTVFVYWDQPADRLCWYLGKSVVTDPKQALPQWQGHINEVDALLNDLAEKL